jgi:exodeoxyribonuclease VII large subunit
MGTAPQEKHRHADSGPSLPRQSDSEKLGRCPERPVPVELAVRTAGKVLNDRFHYDLWFRGELIQLVTASGGHGFAALRGPGTRIDVYLAPRFMRRSEQPQAGSLVLVQGRLRIWEPGGRFQITACGPLLPTDMRGAREEARRAAERELRAQGVLDRPRRTLPRFPARVAVVTSANGAALKDVRATIRRRAPWVRISHHDCLVQGGAAAASIIAALDAADDSRADVVLLTRGGGAPDALDPFEDPAVVRRVARIRPPIIVAIGHEGDRTLAELAADQAASTPTAAAELAVPDGVGLQREMREHRRRMHVAARAVSSAARIQADHARATSRREVRQRLRLWRERLRRVDRGALASSLHRLLRAGRERLGYTRVSLRHAVTAVVREQRHRASALMPGILVTHGEATIRADRHRAEELLRAIRALSPDQVLARGYALVLGADGQMVRASEDLRPGATLRIRLHDGEVAAVVANPVLERPFQGE